MASRASNRKIRTGRALLIAAGLLMVFGLASLLLADRGPDEVPPARPRPTAKATPAESGAGPIPAQSEPASTPVAATAAVAVPPASSSASAPLPLPPLDAPIASVRAELEQRARAGDARAACRLAADLSRCSGVDRRRRFRDYVDPSQRADGGSSQRMAERELNWRVDTTARIEEQLAHDEKVCAGLAPEDTREALTWLYQAASLGSVPAMSSFAGADWWWGGAAVHHPDLVARYAAEAPRMAEAAIAAGDASLLFRLGLVLSDRTAWGGYGPLREVMTPDPVRARALLLAATTIVNAPESPIERPGRRTLRSAERILGELEANLDAGQIAESERQAAVIRSAVSARPASRAAAARPYQPMSEFIPATDCEN
jgi:TPR repeat protein